MSSKQEITGLFQEMGFKPLEAEIYLFLLQHSPAGGYKVAKSLGRSFTNTYKALETMRSKGVVLIEEGKSRPIFTIMPSLHCSIPQPRWRSCAANTCASMRNFRPAEIWDSAIWCAVSAAR